MKHLGLAIAVAGMFVLSQTQAYACFVIKPEVPEALDAARAVFIGEVVEVGMPLNAQTNAPQADRLYKVKFKVVYSWKGAGFRELGAPEIVVLSSQGSDCFSSVLFTKGQRYLVYANESRQKDLVVQLGSRTALLSSTYDDLKELEKMSRPLNFKVKQVPVETMPMTCFMNC